MFKLHAEHIINVSKTISRNAFCRVRILESDEIGVAKIDLPIVRVQQHNIVSSEGYMKPSGASPGGHGCPFSSQLVLHCHCFHCCSFPLQWPPVFDPPGVALSLTLPGFEGSIPSFGDAGRGGLEFPEVLAIAARPSVRCW